MEDAWFELTVDRVHPPQAKRTTTTSACSQGIITGESPRYQPHDEGPPIAGALRQPPNTE